MIKPFIRLMFFSALVWVVSATQCLAGNAIAFTEPASGATVSSPVKFCMMVEGVTAEPAKNGVNSGKGHHHLLIDVNLPGRTKGPLPKGPNLVHLGDGSDCKSLELESGKHIIRALFAKGNHVPYAPALTSTVIINVK
jgi:hypothetical protein